MQMIQPRKVTASQHVYDLGRHGNLIKRFGPKEVAAARAKLAHNEPVTPLKRRKSGIVYLNGFECPDLCVFSTPTL